MTVYILGGGPTGLALALGLGQPDADEFVLIETRNRPGGLAQTLAWHERGNHDLGPHKLFTLDQALLGRVCRLLPEDQWLIRPKTSRIFLAGRYLPYPPTPGSLLSTFGPLAMLAMGMGFLAARIKIGHEPEPLTFERDLRYRLGQPLYQRLLEPIARKLWGDPAALDAKLSRGRVQTPSLADLLRRMFGRRQKTPFEAHQFLYPRGGLSRLWRALQDEAEAHGRFRFRQRVEQLTLEQGRVTAIGLRDTHTEERFEVRLGKEDFLFSTLPLTLLPELFGSAFPRAMVNLIREHVVFNDLILVFAHIEATSLFPDSWIFVADPAVAFHRISQQASFDPGMTPTGSIVCCEFMSHQQRPLSQKSDAELQQAATKGMNQLGLNPKIRAWKVIRLPRSYPVYRPGFQGPLREALAFLDNMQNFRTIGRQGAFNYIGTLDAMDIGFGAARWFREKGSASWPEERRRTELYPVLD